MFRRTGYNSLEYNEKNEGGTVQTEENGIVETKEVLAEFDLAYDLSSEMVEESNIHFEKYLERMDRAYSKKIKMETIDIGDSVLVKKNFDNNTNTKKISLILISQT
ncbi:hypothetical protein NGRA_3016 [Nosema granulosis]|uniref:Uncharacterized protein n=1 Tax=Nosema granulosis TaxID=83296 RepID=A0A9P6GW12_9MICR|nr:hypothetical protein NGRA_3016 [Nosema granulosis]